MKKASSLDLSFFDSPQFHDQYLNARRDSRFIESLGWLAVFCIRSWVQLIMAAALLAPLNGFFSLVLIMLSIPAVIAEKRFTQITYNWMFDRAPEERKMNYIQNILTDRDYAKDVRLFSLFEPLICRFQKLWTQWFSEKSRLSKRRSLWSIGCSILPQLGILAITVLVGLRILSGKLTLGDFSLYTGLASQLFGSIFMLVHSLSQIQESGLHINNYRNFLTWQPRIAPTGSLKPNEFINIEFRQVSFAYPDTDRKVLDNLNVTLSAGDKVALVGLNGAGKSTLIKLLLRFYEPDSGEILLNGINIREYDLEAYRHLFGAVFQDFANYAFTLRENITLSDLEQGPDIGRIQTACRLSGVESLMQKWEGGLDTYLTKQFEPQGEELSGGEWQKVALARAFFRKSEMMILDEPTSALDPEAEHQMFAQFDDLCLGRAAIFISHRLSSVTMADRILVLEQGKIIEDGPHPQLLAQNGRYAYLFNLQAEKYLSGNDGVELCATSSGA